MLIGHSYGGLFVELLLDRGLGRAGVAMSPAPPKGILALPFSTLKAGAPALAHPSKWHGVVTLTPEEFTYAFVNTFSDGGRGGRLRALRGSRRPGQIFYEAGFANFHLHPPTEVHFKNEDRAPLLIVGADRGPHGPGIAGEGAVQALRALAGEDRLPRVRRPASPAHGRPRLAGGRSRVSTAGSTACSTSRSCTPNRPRPSRATNE